MSQNQNALNTASTAIIEIIENQKKAREEYNSVHGSEYGSSELRITAEILQALSDGKCVAINDGEYSFFLTMDTAPFVSLDQLG